MENLPLTTDALIQAINAGFKAKYIFFWGHAAKDHTVGKECFSQWYLAPFVVNEHEYLSAEHYMMAEKARLFGDNALAEKILDVTHPGEAKRLGREIAAFDETIWQTARFEIVVAGNLAKFQQNPTLRDFLLNTGERVIVEASPVDKIWGIGLDQHHAQASNPQAWLGLNLLGFALMKVRAQLKNNN